MKNVVLYRGLNPSPRARESATELFLLRTFGLKKVYYIRVGLKIIDYDGKDDRSQFN